MRPNSPVATTSVLPSATDTLFSLRSDELNSRDLESGDHSRPPPPPPPNPPPPPFSVSLSESFLRPLPCSSQIHTSSRPERSETKAIHLPSGDQEGWVSRDPGEFSTRLMSPRSVAMENNSPWMEITARRVVAERS